MQTAPSQIEASIEFFFKPYLKIIENAISKKLETLNSDNRLHQALQYALKSGKRFRPALVLMVAEALSKGFDATNAALAIEYFHNATLIADDLPCMDDDDVRRNQPTVHKAFDEATALLASYALIAEGFHLIAENGEILEKALGHEGAKAALLAFKIASYNTGIHGATGGQYLDIFPPALDEALLSKIHHMKTTALFEIAFTFGWLFGGGPISKLNSVRELAASFGMAFQIADDFDDYESDRQERRAANMVLLLGKQAAFLKLFDEVNSFQRTLKDLGLENSRLALIGKLLLEWGKSASKLIPSQPL